MAVDKAEHIIYLCSPYVRSLQDLEERQMKLADIPVHDVTRDMLWVELMVRYVDFIGNIDYSDRFYIQIKVHKDSQNHLRISVIQLVTIVGISHN